MEYELKQRIDTLAEQTGVPKPTGPLPYVPLTNMYGIDIEHVAVSIARVVLWMGHRQVMELYGEAEAPLPLVSLPGLRAADALRTEWPQVDAIIGNPPFLGSQLLRESLGGDYLAWLSKEFGVGIKDLCVYWFRKANDHLEPGQRAGLVGTNSISQNRARGASLEYVANNGGVITDAVSTQKWPGEAKVHVSIVNWIKEPASALKKFELDGERVDGITPSLTAGGADVWEPVRLDANKRKCFQGPIPVGAGFVVSAEIAHDLHAQQGADYAQVVRPYVVGEDLTTRPDQSPSRWIIDFVSKPLEDAMKYPKALEIVRREVMPFRETVRREGHRIRWWIFGEPRRSMRTALAEKPRYITGTATGKRLCLAWQPAEVCPSNLVNVFAFDDDYSMGVLLSRAHDAWAWAQSSTLETRLRYTPTTVFETFPWPEPTGTQRETIARASAVLYERRSELCLEHNLGLTKLYNLMDEGGFRDLHALHRQLDEAVADAYGWPKSVAQDNAELVSRLRDLNRRIVEEGIPYTPFG